jgi:vesicle coat complex subunit
MFFFVLKNFFFSPDILKNEMKVFFVKYNDPIYVKLEKLDIMIRLTNATNIAQVLAELKE